MASPALRADPATHSRLLGPALSSQRAGEPGSTTLVPDVGMPLPQNSSGSMSTSPRPSTLILPSISANELRCWLLFALSRPQILSTVVSHLSWRSCWSLLSTCWDCRDLFSYPELKDVILSRFVPAYSACLRLSDPLRLQIVPVTLADLNLLMISQRVILHRYPMHAVTSISGLLSDVDHAGREQTEKYVALAQAHTRFVLLLQALAHSSSLPPPPEQEEVEWQPVAEPKLRQLNFPAPLSFIPLAASESPSPTLRSARGRKSSDSVENSPPKTLRSLSRPESRLSIFLGSGPKIPHPPASEPQSLKHYSSGWRHAMSRLPSSASDDEWGRLPLERPRRRFASVNLSSESSSNSNSPPPPFSRSSTLERTWPVRRNLSYHDLNLATSRIRAPVLRVFVPCTQLDTNSIALCEDQLDSLGLWNHLSTGDIICNLGYVPNPPPSSPDEPGSSGGSPDSAGGEHALKDQRKWLLFNGEALVPFSPPAPLPLRNPFILPSPYYFSHIMPTPQTNPVLTVRCFPACDDIPQLTLSSTSVKVRSPHSPTGYALAKKAVWHARVWKQIALGEDVGLGWAGEWVLEGEGTREGQKVLIECLRGVVGPYREWELVREKSGGDRLWFRLIRTLSRKRTRAKSHAN